MEKIEELMMRIARNSATIIMILTMICFILLLIGALIDYVKQPSKNEFPEVSFNRNEFIAQSNQGKEIAPVETTDPEEAFSKQLANDALDEIFPIYKKELVNFIANAKNPDLEADQEKKAKLT